MSTQLRLQRFLAQAGLASRRKAEELILAGKIKVNGTVIRELGTSVDPEQDAVLYQGKRLFLEDRVWLLLNKPVGIMCTTHDPEGRRTVMDLLGDQGVRLYPVGRLDYQTEGVLLLTNDGALAHALMHPRQAIQRVYQVKIKGMVEMAQLDQLRAGVILDTGEKVAAQVHILGTTEKHTWLEMTLTQGLNHQIHRMIQCVGGTVLKLIRVAFAGLTAEGLKVGHFRALAQAEINRLRQETKLPHLTRRNKAALPGERRARGTERHSSTKHPQRGGKDAVAKGKTSASHRATERKKPPSRRGKDGASTTTAKAAKRGPQRKRP